MRRVMLIVVGLWLAMLPLTTAAIAAQRTTIALTATRNAGSNEAIVKLTDSLVALLELQMLENDSLSVVERQQIDLAMQELALSRSRSADESLRLGNLVTADLLVMLELRASVDKQNNTPSAMLRIVEAKTAAIRGITVAADVEETSLEEIAEQFVRYISAVVREPKQRTITIAVAPFESVGRFDRLRPLELGLRDLVTSRMGTLACPSDETTGTGKSIHPTIQILQRSNLEHLLREFDLIQSGFADQDRLPLTLPDRQAAYLIRGEIDEKQTDGRFEVVVRASLIHAATGKPRDSFEFTSFPAELEIQLNRHVDELCVRLEKQTIGIDRAPRIEKVESTSLKQLALRDLHRFRRQCPIDFSPRAFAMPGEPWLRDVPRLVRSETPLGQALLRKSIDRLESALFIHTDDAEAAYALGFCFSIHQPGIYRPDRADELLRTAASRKPDSQLAAYALTMLSELAFADDSGNFDPFPRGAARDRDSLKAASKLASARLWLAFETMPAAFRDHRWTRILELLGRLNPSPEQTAELLGKVIPYAEQAEGSTRRGLAGQVQQLAQRLATQSKQKPALKGQAIDALRRWADGTQADLADVGRQGLAAIHEINGEFLDAAKQYEASAAILADATSVEDQHKRQIQWIKAAKNYRLAKDPERALQLLRSFEPQTTLISLLVGMHDYELGACYEALGEPQPALAAYLHAAEQCPLIVPNTNLVERVTALGGVPLREDREIDVTYHRGQGQPARIQCLATDGRRLFVGGTGVFAFDADEQTWLPLKSDLMGVLCLKFRDGQLWAGTNSNGLWRCDLATGRWSSFGNEQGLPDLRVESIAFRDDRRIAALGNPPAGTDVFAGVGTLASGGLVRIDERGTVHLLNEPQAPSIVPTHLVVTDQELLARTLTTIHKYSWTTKKWELHPQELNRPTLMVSRLFAGSSGVWASNYGRELIRWGDDAESNQVFQPAWYFVPGTKAGYIVHFVAEHGDDVWFGGQPWDNFVSSGLYRINQKTGSFTKFTPAAGFAQVREHGITDGLWWRDRLWLATSSGLCAVAPRQEKRAKATP